MEIISVKPSVGEITVRNPDKDELYVLHNYLRCFSCPFVDCSKSTDGAEVVHTTADGVQVAECNGLLKGKGKTNCVIRFPNKVVG